MEKLMFFGLAIWFALMTAVPPRPVKMPPRPAPAGGPNDIETVTRNESQASADKPVKINYTAQFWHSPE